LILARGRTTANERPDCVRAAAAGGGGEARVVETGIIIGTADNSRPKITCPRRLSAARASAPSAILSICRPSSPASPLPRPVLLLFSIAVAFIERYDERFLGRFLALSMTRGFSFRLAFHGWILIYRARPPALFSSNSIAEIFMAIAGRLRRERAGDKKSVSREGNIGTRKVAPGSP